ncbi:hypothetical protein Tco_1329126 [Tanacetum coccineum]
MQVFTAMEIEGLVTAVGIRQEGTLDIKEKCLIILNSQKIELLQPVTEKGTLLGNADLEGIKGEDLMVTMAGAMHQQIGIVIIGTGGHKIGPRSL